MLEAATTGASRSGRASVAGYSGSGPTCSMKAASAATCWGSLSRRARLTAASIAAGSYPASSCALGSSRPSRTKRSSTSTVRPSASLTRCPAKLEKLGASARALAAKWQEAQPSLTIRGAPWATRRCSCVNGSVTYLGTLGLERPAPGAVLDPHPHSATVSATASARPAPPARVRAGRERWGVSGTGTGTFSRSSAGGLVAILMRTTVPRK